MQTTSGGGYAPSLVDVTTDRDATLVLRLGRVCWDPELAQVGGPFALVILLELQWARAQHHNNNKKVGKVDWGTTTWVAMASY